MKRIVRVTAMFLAVMVVLCGLPYKPASAASAARKVAPAAASGPEMKFVETDFDTNTGILTMTLKIRTTVPGAKDDQYDDEHQYTGNFVRDGYLAFQVDSQSIRPITSSGDEILSYDRIAYVGFASSKLSSFLDETTGQGWRIGTEDFETEITGENHNLYDNTYTGLLVSSSRKEETSMLDCYLQFKLNEGNGLLTPGEDGYVDAVSLRFQCYSGSNDEPATGENGEMALFSKSIRLPKGVAAADDSPTDDEELVKQFFTLRDNTSSACLAKGAAGFTERGDYKENLWGGYGFSPVASSYYYSAPATTAWTETSSALSALTPTKLTGTPVLSYANMENTYILQGFGADLMNTYSSDTLPEGVEPDFTVPAGEDASSGKPRYKIPTVEDEERLSDGGEETGWIPERYDPTDTVPRQQPLKYLLSSIVSRNSEQKPENDTSTGGMTGFLDSLQWRFTFQDKTELNVLLEEYDVGDTKPEGEKDAYKYLNLVGEPENVETDFEEFTIQQAVIDWKQFEYDDEKQEWKAFKYDGCKVQIVTPEFGDTVVTPVGVMLVNHMDTQVVYYNIQNVEQDPVTGYAPQLWIRSSAADTESYLWSPDQIGENGNVFLKVSYIAPTGGLFEPEQPPMQIKLYKSESVATTVYGTSPDDGEADEVYALSVPVDAGISGIAPESNDQLLADGLTFTFRVSDQYGFLTKDKSTQQPLKPTVAIAPADQETRDAIAAKYKAAAPFQMVEDTENRAEDGGYIFSLKYGLDESRNSLTVNDVTPGSYRITASYGSAVWERIVQVTKDEDVFSYMETEMTVAAEKDPDPETGAKVVNLTVPAPDANWQPQSPEEPVKVRFLEMANQWRIPGSDAQTASRYDMFPDLRRDNNMQLGVAILTNRVEDHFDVTYDWTDAEGATMQSGNGLDLSNRAQGSFNYDSDIPDGTVMFLTVSAKVKNSSETPLTNQYKFVFRREASQLDSIRLTGTSTTMEVPVQGSTTNLSLLALAYDQYGAGYTWDDVLYDYNTGIHKATGFTFQPWKLVIKEEQDGTLDQAISDGSITIADDVTGSGHHEKITITSAMEPITLHAWIEFRGVSANPSLSDKVFTGSQFTINITRGKSVATTIQTISSDKKTAYVPDKTKTDPETINFTAIVYDQFGKEMEVGTGEEQYTIVWSFDRAVNGQLLNAELRANTGLTLKDADGVLEIAPRAAAVTAPFAVKAVVYQGGDMVTPELSQSITGLQVLRRDLRVTEVELNQGGTGADASKPGGQNNKLTYPDSSSTTPWYYLTASSQTQYSLEDQKDDVSWQKLTWRLEEVELANGHIIKRVDGVTSGGDERLTNNIKLVGGSYTTTELGYENLLALESETSTPNGGMLTLGMANDRDLAPIRVRVTAIYDKSEVQDTKDIYFYLADSVPDSIEIWSTVNQKNLEVPDLGDESNPKAHRDLGAYVRDQFSFIMKDNQGNNVQPLWSIKAGTELTGVTLSGAHLSVDSTCTGGNTTLVATYIQTSSGASGPAQSPVVVTAERAIGVSFQAGTAKTVEFLGIRGQERTNNKVPLAGLTADGKSYRQSSFILEWEVKDNYGVVMPGKAVTLTLNGSNPYNMLKMTGGQLNQDGTIVYACTDAWKNDTVNGNQDVTVSFTVTVDGELWESNPITADYTVVMERQEDEPAYAIPTLGQFTASDREGFTDRVMIPSPDYVADHSAVDGGRTNASFTAKVYSQYGTEMTTGVASEIRLSKAEPGVEMEMDQANNSSRLLIGPQMSSYTIKIIAVPVKQSGSSYVDAKTVTVDESTIEVLLDRGAGYANGVAMGVGDLITVAGGALEVENSNSTEGYVGLWAVDPVLNKNVPPAAETISADEFTFDALVVDQYLAGFTAKGYYPVWDFVGDHTGVNFADSNSADAAGNISGVKVIDEDGRQYYKVTIQVSKDALSQSEAASSKTITLRARMGYRDKIYKGDTHKTFQTFVLKKAASKPTYLYFKDVDADGVLTETWYRPTLAEGVSTYALETEIYDQYGYLYAEDKAPAVAFRLMDNLLPSGYTAVPTYDKGVNPADPGDAQPIKYQIMHGSECVADFVAATAEVRLYTACTLQELSFEASAAGQVKQLKANIDIDGVSGLIPTRMQVRRTDGTGVVNLTKDDEEVIEVGVEVMVWDQFGDRFTRDAAFPVWELQTAEGVLYQDFDDEGSLKSQSDWLVIMRPGSSGNRNETGVANITLNIQPLQFVENTKVLVKCSLRMGMATAAAWSGIDDQTVEVEIRRKKKPSTPTTPGDSDSFTVTYLPGEHGGLSGESQEEVLPGGRTEKTPVVYPDPGYGVSGWRTDSGEFVKEPSSIEIWANTEFTVEYFDVTARSFLDGYDDSTVRPQKAVTRGEFIKMLVLAINHYDPHTVYSHPFTDVDPGRYYSNYIGYAYSLGIIGGYGDGTFRPNQTITRAEAAKVVAKAAKLTSKGRAVAFSDVAPGGWYEQYVAALVEQGVVNGYKDGTFRPANDLSRAEAVKLLVLIMEDAPSETELERIRRNGLCPFIDVNKTYWAYPYILRASGMA